MNKKVIIGLILGTLLFGSLLTTNNSTSTNTTSVIAPKIETSSKNTVTTPKIDTTDGIDKSTQISTTEVTGDKYYINVDGNKIQSPTYSNNGSVPAGATAKCGDGTYSFSQHRSGTCSHHGGVVRWL